MLQIGVKSNLDDVIKTLDAFSPDQFPFAVAKALTDTAEDAVQAVKATMPSNFTLRRDLVVRSVKKVPATKSTLQAIVYSTKPFMARQEYGTPKVPMAGKYLAVPLGARPDPTKVIPTALLPANLGQVSPIVTTKRGTQRALKGTGGSAFFLHAADGRIYLAVRTPMRGLQIMYLLLPQAQIKPRFGMGQTTIAVVRAKFATNLRAACALAMSTARRGGKMSDPPKE